MNEEIIISEFFNMPIGNTSVGNITLGDDLSSILHIWDFFYGRNMLVADFKDPFFLSLQIDKKLIIEINLIENKICGLGILTGFRGKLKNGIGVGSYFYELCNSYSDIKYNDDENYFQSEKNSNIFFFMKDLYVTDDRLNEIEEISICDESLLTISPRVKLNKL